jgi:hypothetical protein
MNISRLGGVRSTVIPTEASMNTSTISSQPRSSNITVSRVSGSSSGNTTGNTGTNGSSNVYEIKRLGTSSVTQPNP